MNLGVVSADQVRLAQERAVVLLNAVARTMGLNQEARAAGTITEDQSRRFDRALRELLVQVELEVHILGRPEAAEELLQIDRRLSEINQELADLQHQIGTAAPAATRVKRSGVSALTVLAALGVVAAIGAVAWGFASR